MAIVKVHIDRDFLAMVLLFEFMGVVAEQVRQIAADISIGLHGNGWDQRPTPDGRLFPSYRQAGRLPGESTPGIIVSDTDVQDSPLFGKRASWISVDLSGTVKQRSAVLDASLGAATVVQTTFREGKRIGGEIIVVADEDNNAEGRPGYPSVATDTPRRRASTEESQAILNELKMVIVPLRGPRNAAPAA